MALEYLLLAEKYPPSNFLKVIKPHMFRMLYGLFDIDTAATIEHERRRNVQGCAEGEEGVVGVVGAEGVEVVEGVEGEEDTEKKEESKSTALERLQDARTIEGCRRVVQELEVVELQLSPEKQVSIRLSWYHRHRKKIKKKTRGHTLILLKPQEIKKASKARKRKWLESGTRMK